MKPRHAATGLGPWVVISNFPTWPSPYFAELERHAPPALRLDFAARLDALADRPGLPGVINLHRLKRLYQEPGGRRTAAGAEVMLEQLRDLRAIGWRLVWTVHNLFPIDGGSPAVADQSADRHAAHGVLALADAVVTHTHTDANHARTLTRAPVTVAGWAAPIPAPGPPPAPVATLARSVAEAPFAVLALGNMAVYKNLPAVVDAFTRATEHAELFLIGPSPDREHTDVLTRRVSAAGGRVHLHPQRVPPGHIHMLYQAADAALCPYRVDGAWSFLARLFYPGSVATALAYNTPIIAPDLPAIREMTKGSPRWLYAPAAGPGPALAVAEASEDRRTMPAASVAPDHAGRWQSIAHTYVHLARTVSTTSNAHQG